ncbi:MAG TPA: aspartate aminotransferase family protein, partial [Aggregatilineales bacterium]|nr:aspartate aminotransferase family protein [Aggregatilineales bacterium]
FPAATPYHGDNPIAFSHAKDQYVWDVDGNRYLDFFGGVLTVSIGHCNEYVTQRIIEQVQKVQHVSTLYVSEPMVKLAEKLAEIAPGRLQTSYFTNSGSEANETAIMAARMYTGNRTIITMRHAYSGRTMAAMSLTAHGTWRLGGVFDGEIKHIRNPYSFRAPPGITEDNIVDLVVHDLEETLATLTSGKIAAFMAEPIQGVGGFITPPKDFFKRILPIVRNAGGVFIADEVQTAWGRTGHKWFGIEQWDVEPDIMTSAKGMANGAPIGWTITTPEIAEAVKGATFSTFGGNPVTMAAALATIEYIEEHNLLENAAEQGATFRERLEELKSEFPFIGDVRGMGLMQAIEIIKPGSPDKQPDPQVTVALVNSARKNGLLIGKGGLYGNIIRMAPHLNVSAEDMNAGCDLLAKSIADVVQ